MAYRDRYEDARQRARYRDAGYRREVDHPDYGGRYHWRGERDNSAGHGRDDYGRDLPYRYRGIEDERDRFAPRRTRAERATDYADRMSRGWNRAPGEARNWSGAASWERDPRPFSERNDRDRDSDRYGRDESRDHDARWPRPNRFGRRGGGNW